MNKASRTYTIIVFFVAFCLLGLLVFLNTKDYSKKEITTTTTTTKQTVDLIYDKTEEVLIDGEYKTIPIKTYMNSLYKIEYDVQKFDIVNISNGDFYIKSKENGENYLCIQTLTYEEYQEAINKQSEPVTNQEEITKVSYVNFEGTDTYLKVITNINDDHSEIMPRFNYMLSTLSKP